MSTATICAYLEVLSLFAIEEGVSGSSEISHYHQEQVARVVRDDVIPHPQPLPLGEDLTEQSLQQWPGIELSQTNTTIGEVGGEYRRGKEVPER